MAYTLPIEMQIRVAVPVTGNITGTGVQTPFQLPWNFSGFYHGQATFQALLDTVADFTADLEVDMTGDDANFLPRADVLAHDFVAESVLVEQMTGGNVRYRWNVKSWTGTGAVIWATAG